MIREAVLHLNNEQPMRADLFELPEAADVGLRCTNLRTMNGQRPVFVDDSAAVFFFPYQFVRFVEIPPASVIGTNLSMPVAVAVAVAVAPVAVEPVAPASPIEDDDLEIDEDFLRRIREV